MGGKQQIFKKGFSLVEILVVILIFSILAVITTQTLVLSLRGSRKSESVARVRENIDYSLSVMQRLLRNAKSVNCPDNKTVSFIDEYGNTGQFVCTSEQIASGSAQIRITSPNVNIDCSGTVFTCPSPTPPAPPSVIISIKASDAKTSGAESAQVTVTSKVLLRAY